MNQRLTWGLAALLLAAALPGCGQGLAPLGSPEAVARDAAGEVVMDAGGQPVPYRLMGATALAPAGLIASTTENSYHPASAAADHNAATAWAPLWNDAAPALTFSFNGNVGATALTLRTSPAGVAVAVAIWNGSGWTPLKSGLTPPANVSTRYTLPNLPTSRIRLSFSGVRASDLFVCEAHFEGAPALCEADN